MRGGLYSDLPRPYSDSDLEREFAGTHILIVVSAVYTAVPQDDPGAEPTRAASAAELAMKLRAQQQVIDEIKRGAQLSQ